MGQDTTVRIDPAIFARNLGILRQIDPALAGRLEGEAIPPSVTPTTGRDGTPTYRLTDAGGRLRWFGGTSAPTVSAPALVRAFDAGNGNVLMCGIGHGAEVQVLLRQMEPYRGVLVVEPNILSLALALRLHDFAEALSLGRLRFLTCSLDGLPSALREFLLAHDGYLPPERILRWPWHGDGEMSAVRRAVEEVAQEIGPHRAAQLARVQAAQAALSPTPTLEGSRVVIFDSNASSEAWTRAKELESAARSLGWTVFALVVRSPLDCHILKPARELVRLSPGWLLALDTWPSDVHRLAGNRLPIACWFDQPVRLPRSRDVDRGPGVIAATSCALADTVREHLPQGISIDVVPYGVASSPVEVPPFESRPVDVAVRQDGGPIDPVACGLRLYAQQTLWREVASVVRREIDSYVDARAEAVFASAERLTQTRIQDDSVRTAFLQAVRDTLGPRLVAAEAVFRLCGAGLSTHLWGTGWDFEAVSSAVRYGARPRPDELPELLQRVKVLVVPTTTGHVTRLIWQAVAAGAVIVVRRHPDDERPGGIGSVFREGEDYLSYRSSSELVSACRRLVADSGRWSAVSRAARERATCEHGLGARLERLRDLLLRAIERSGTS